MKLSVFLVQYVIWHYTKAIKGFFSTWFNFLWFTYHFFSIPLLLRTLFSPFERLGEEYKKGLDVWALFQTFAVNAIMRCVGAVTRLVLVVIGTLMIIFIFAVGIVLFFVWLLIPLIVATLVILGVNGLIQ
jgi:hypothetical protein